MSISLNSFTCSFSIETKFGSHLEFVLLKARERNPGTGPKRWLYNSGVSNPELIECEYYEILWNMFRKELQRSKVSVDDCQIYGGISFVLRAGSIEDLFSGLATCKKVVSKWMKMYNIDKMKAD